MLIVADARRLPLRDSCVSAVVTSPPYWGLRDYGSADQIGLERTPDAYVASLVAVFAEVRRVLVDDGTVWLNLGDSYVANGSGQVPQTKQHTGSGFAGPNRDGMTGLQPKNLIGIPWRVALALQADGWFLRSDVIWHKPNPMPESVTDRPTTAHEHLFLLAKAARYYYDADAIQEAVSGGAWVDEARRRVTGRGVGKETEKQVSGRQPQRSNSGWFPARKNDTHVDHRKHGVNEWDQRGQEASSTRNRRTVWTIPTMPYAGAHFATMPEALVEPCILAGCPVGGLVCDPFVGSGTVGAVAERLGRRWVGTDLSYQPLATARTAQRGLRW